MPLQNCPECGELDFSERHKCDPIWRVAFFVEAQEWEVSDWDQHRGSQPREAAESFLYERWVNAGGDWSVEDGPFDIVLQKEGEDEIRYVRLVGEYEPTFWSEEFPDYKRKDFEPGQYA